MWTTAWNGPYYQIDDGIAESSINWLFLSEDEGDLIPTECITIGVTFNAGEVNSGDFAADILIFSNDPDESEITITASMSVTGAPNLSMELESVDFGEVWIGTSSAIPVTITNSGTDILEITNIQVSGGEFSVNTSSFSLNPGDNNDLEVNFTPSGLDDQTGTITITSNDPDTPVSEIPISGIGVGAPEIDIPIGLNPANLFTGDSETQTLTINNDGGSDLEFEINIDNSRDEEGWLWNDAWWYTATDVGMSCNQVCEDKGGFDAEGSIHVGNDVGNDVGLLLRRQ